VQGFCSRHRILFSPVDEGHFCASGCQQFDEHSPHELCSTHNDNVLAIHAVLSLFESFFCLQGSREIVPASAFFFKPNITADAVAHLDPRESTAPPSQMIRQPLALLVVCGLLAHYGASGEQFGGTKKPALRTCVGFLAGQSPASFHSAGTLARRSTCPSRIPATVLRAGKQDPERKLGTTVVIDGIKRLTDTVSGAVKSFNEMRKEAADVEQLKVVLGESEFENVKRTIGSIMARHREEKRVIENKAREEQKKLTKEVRNTHLFRTGILM
jgi:hypothetical protein